eukprot:scaffold39210_cov49-Tisochrysis_lutea.AAC.1
MGERVSVSVGAIQYCIHARVSVLACFGFGIGVRTPSLCKLLVLVLAVAVAALAVIGYWNTVHFWLLAIGYWEQHAHHTSHIRSGLPWWSWWWSIQRDRGGGIRGETGGLPPHPRWEICRCIHT